jgi:hypothetical protein
LALFSAAAYAVAHFAPESIATLRGGWFADAGMLRAN